MIIREFNNELWGRTPDQNTLYVIGMSGSGKSTYANKRNNYMTYVIHLDSYFDCPEGVHCEVFDKYLSKVFPDYVKISYPIDKIDISEWGKLVMVFEKELLNFAAICYGKRRRVIVEGVQLLDDTLYPDKKFFSDKPVVLCDADIITAIRRRNKRDNKRLHINDFKNAMQWQKEIEKFLNDAGFKR